MTFRTVEALLELSEDEQVRSLAEELASVERGDEDWHELGVKLHALLDAKQKAGLVWVRSFAAYVRAHGSPTPGDEEWLQALEAKYRRLAR